METLSISTFQRDARRVLDEVEKEDKPVYISNHQQTAVIITLGKYRAFMQRLEDLEDALDLKKAIDTSTKIRPYDEYLKERNLRQIECIK
ncbi:MAG: type II toxin-antitoxin system Phd/YefM family antitoxin [bacterium]|nr:type II toxin-antitoxin system Phd/YefM family antitoxin [bacterium]